MTAETDESKAVTRRAHSSKLLATWRILCLLGATARVVPPYAFRKRRLHTEEERNRLLYQGTQDWLTAMGKAAGISVCTVGEPPERGAFIAPNHISYADILALSAAMKTWYVSKADVLEWPLFNRIFRFSNNLTVNRTDIRCLQATNAGIAARINANYNVCVFLEGTSSDGNSVLPFRGPLLQPALDGATDIVPVHIQWRADDPNIDIGEDVAYWRDHAILPHALRLLGFRGLHATIHFGNAIPAQGERKELAKRVHDAVVALRD